MGNIFSKQIEKNYLLPYKKNRAEKIDNFKNLHNFIIILDKNNTFIKDSFFLQRFNLFITIFISKIIVQIIFIFNKIGLTK